MKGDNPTCISSCPNCDFALITGKHGSAWKLQFNKKIQKILKKTNSLDLHAAQLIPLDFSYPGGSKKGKIDGRICLVDDSGKNAYIAALNDHGVFHADLSKKLSLNRLIKNNKGSPYGLNWDKRGDILVSMHKQEVWRINSKGQKLATYNIIDAECPGTKKYNPNLRAAIDDPLNKNSLIILASNPRSYDAVLWRLKYNKMDKPIECKILAGKIGRNSGWVDSNKGGKAVYFSRPHYFTLLPDGTDSKIIVTDIDNRSLRIVDLSTGSTTTIMYDRDRRVPDTPEKDKKSALSCQQQHWSNATQTVSALGKDSCIQAPSNDSSQLSYSDAKAYCNAQGARLCEPKELRLSNLLINKKSWTSAECASCWHAKPGLSCDSIIETFKSSGVHSTKGFKHSWSSGQAIEIGGASNKEKATFCSSSNNKNKASAFCCADAF